MNRFTSWLRILQVAYSSWLAILSTSLAGVALCNFIFRIFEISISDAIRWLLAAYRQTFHPPIDFLFSWLPFSLPLGVKDLLLVYLAIGGVLYRALSYNEASAMSAQFPLDWNFAHMRFKQVLAAIVWPRVIRGIWKNPCLLVRSEQGFHGRLPPMTRAKAESFLKEWGGPNAVIFADDRELILLYFAALIAVVGALVTLNAAINVLTGGY